MSLFDSQYAVTKDISNNPIVLEVDEARQRELWRSVAVGVFLVAVLLFSAWQHFELLRHGYRIEQMQQELAEQAEINRHLRLEIETLASPRRIEQIATDELHLVAPTSGDAIVIQRVAPTPGGDQSVSAAQSGGSVGRSASPE